MSGQKVSAFKKSKSDLIGINIDVAIRHNLNKPVGKIGSVLDS